jgi:hypothetical protein
MACTLLTDDRAPLWVGCAVGGVQVGNQYSGGAMDASIQSTASKAAWKQALDIMQAEA